MTPPDVSGEWVSSQETERAWWGNCANSYQEETKQLTYANRMGLVPIPPPVGRWPLYSLAGRSVLDLGGGPVSILLKTHNGGRMVVVDPCDYPRWVADRYASHGIEYVRQPAEEFTTEHRFDEAWIYNVLQHVQSPEQVIRVARQAAHVIRLFEWVNLPVYEGHPHSLVAERLDRWLGSPGTTERMTEPWCSGFYSYHGVFPSRTTKKPPTLEKGEGLVESQSLV